MVAIIVGLNLRKGRAVAKTLDGEYVLIEIITDDFELHDEIKGNFGTFPLGDMTIFNITSSASLDIYIHNYESAKLAYEFLTR